MYRTSADTIPFHTSLSLHPDVSQHRDERPTVFGGDVERRSAGAVDPVDDELALP